MSLGSNLALLGKLASGSLDDGLSGRVRFRAGTGAGAGVAVGVWGQDRSGRGTTAA